MQAPSFIQTIFQMSISQKQSEIFELLLGEDPSRDLIDAGYIFEQITLLP